MTPVPIYFDQRPLHRERQRDTVRRIPPAFTAILPPVGPEIPDHAVNVTRVRSIRGRIASMASRAPVALNAGAVRAHGARSAALLYTWGKIPVWPRRPRYVVELDNPYVLTLYHNTRALTRARPVLRRTLLGRRCAGIVCISEACRRTLAATLGDDVARKARRVYPFIADGPRAEPGRRDRPEVLFVGTQFWLKGGRELCDAFSDVCAQGLQAHLTVVSRVTSEITDRYRGAPISFVDSRLPRTEVVERLLPSADLFVLPTLQESFGMAALEALAAGLPIVATDVYALREIVEDGRNGILLPDALGMWQGDVANRRLWAMRDIDGYARAKTFPGLRTSIAEALGTVLTDRDRLRRMAEASTAIFRERFAPAVRAASFETAMGDFLRG